MIEIQYILHVKSGETKTHRDREAPHVPRVGEVVVFVDYETGPENRIERFQVVDVVWSVGNLSTPVEVTACEISSADHREKIEAECRRRLGGQ